MLYVGRIIGLFPHILYILVELFIASYLQQAGPHADLKTEKIKLLIQIRPLYHNKAKSRGVTHLFRKWFVTSDLTQDAPKSPLEHPRPCRATLRTDDTRPRQRAPRDWPRYKKSRNTFPPTCPHIPKSLLPLSNISNNLTCIQNSL